MTVYIEYAFAQNFLLDSALLWLSFYAARQKTKLYKIVLAGLVGAIFALAFPLLYLPEILVYVLKFLVGALLCLIAYGKVNTKREWQKYALVCALFFTFTFCVGGALVGLFGENISLPFVAPIALIAILFLIVLIQKIYKKRTVHRFIYDCMITHKGKHIPLLGFYDSGNLATKNGLPVCFLSPDVFYDIFGDEIFQKGAGQVFDEVAFTTLSGEKKLPAVCAELSVKKNGQKCKVYFAPSANMLKREYPLLLSGNVNVQGR